MSTKKILAIFAILTMSCIQAQTYVKLKTIEPAPGSGYSIGTGTNGSPVYTKSLSITTLSATNGYFTGSINTQTNNASYTSASSGMIGSLNSGTVTSGSFIKTGSTSSEFLKGDGSSDGTTYLSTATASANYLTYTGANSSLQMGSQFIGLGVAPSYPLHVVNTNTPQARFAYDATNMFDINVPSNGNAILALKSGAQFIFNNNINLTGLSIATGTGAGLGLTIGTTTTSRLGFYGATPVAQRSATTDLGDVLSNTGLRAAGTAYPITTSGAINFTGAFSTSNLKSGYVAKTSTYTITTSDYTIDCTSGTFTVTLPTAVGNAGRIYVVRNGGTGTITIACNGAQTINGVATKILNTQYSGFTIMSDGANNIIIGSF